MVGCLGMAENMNELIYTKKTMLGSKVSEEVKVENDYKIFLMLNGMFSSLFCFDILRFF